MYKYNNYFSLDSPYRTAISGAVLRLQEQGKLKEMKKKWWSHWKSNNSKCEVSIKFTTHIGRDVLSVF